MSIPRRITSLSFTALVVLSSSVFFIPQKVHAQAGSLQQNQQIIENQKKQVANKSVQIAQTTDDIAALEAKKRALAEQLEQEKATVESLNQKLAEKKAAAEAEAKRVEQLKNMFVHINVYADNAAGNTYAAGYCTWYAKSRRPDLPNRLGNANTWYANAAAQGWGVGSAPKKGAVATSQSGYYGHVAYVEGVSLDGSTVTISEMNYSGLYVVSSRTVPASEFMYIYEKN